MGDVIEQWKLIQVGQNFPNRLSHDDVVFYMYPYRKGGKFEDWPGTSWIMNLKKFPPKEGRSDYYWRDIAINKMADHLAQLVAHYPLAVLPVPPSKHRADPLYDDRLDQVVARALAKCSAAFSPGELRIKANLQSSHLGGTRRPDEIAANLEFVSTSELDVAKVLIVDDVITSGGHFRACCDVLAKVWPHARFFGAMWAWTDHADSP